MNIDWKSRLTHKAWWVSIISLVILLSQQCGVDLTAYIPKNYADIINTVFAILVLLGISVDTSTPTLNDSIINIESANISGQAEKVKTESTTTSINGNITQNNENK